METEAKYTIVGSAVLVLLAALVAAALWLRSSGEGNDARQFTIYFERQSLEGLEPRSYVTMRGMRVGSVKSFRFSSRRPGAVEVLVSLEPSTPVLESTRATVERHLVTGLASVRLVNLAELSPPLAKAPPGEAQPVIAEGESTMQQVTSTLAQLALRADGTMQRVDALLSPDNVAALAGTLDNLRRLTQRAEATLARSDQAIGAAGAAADEIRAMARSVAGDVRTLAARYDTLGADAGASVRDLGEAVRRIGADVERLTQRADALLAGGDGELRSTAQALRSAADAVGDAAARLRDPAGVIYGPARAGLGPGEGGR